MSSIPLHNLPSSRRLVRATIVSILVAGALLVTVVMPAEFGIDPVGTGRLLGLDALHDVDAVNDAPDSAPAAAPATDRDAVLAANAKSAFGESKGQSFDAAALSPTSGSLSRRTMTVSLAPGKGVEVKAALEQGQGLVFSWLATAPIAVDMHGERPDAKNAWTSYAVERAQESAAGTFVAPFTGTHGWYWKNLGDAPVDVTIDVAGAGVEIYQP
ncbi:hypothetical protein ACQQ2N_04275 [Dokdonella sp. MW10]|uniref:hypothetical protein n=1 Tax=Dokdonella sp. MW10 TaxID=2992926 RepID=UPI003F7D31BD